MVEKQGTENVTQKKMLMKATPIFEINAFDFKANFKDWLFWSKIPQQQNKCH